MNQESKPRNNTTTCAWCGQLPQAQDTSFLSDEELADAVKNENDSHGICASCESKYFPVKS